jgi:hypothetical protein
VPKISECRKKEKVYYNPDFHGLWTKIALIWAKDFLKIKKWLAKYLDNIVNCGVFNKKSFPMCFWW